MVVTLPEPYKPRNDFERDYLESGKEAVPFHEKCLYVYALNNTDEANFMWMTYKELQKECYFVYVVKLGMKEVICAGEALGTYLEKNCLNGVYKGVLTPYSTYGEDAIKELEWK